MGHIIKRGDTYLVAGYALLKRDLHAFKVEKTLGAQVVVSISRQDLLKVALEELSETILSAALSKGDEK